jgi:hypothetical protein
MRLRDLFEASKKTAVVAFGRMNPPTIGHAKLVKAIEAHEGDHYVFLSQTQNPKENPLPFDVKLNFFKKFFPGINAGHPSVRTPIQMMQMLEKLGYTDVVYVAGSDRVESFTKLFNDYNGKEYNFDSITVVSAGERDPDADGAEGMSASKMRRAAASGDYENFALGTPDVRLAQKMYDAVRTGMGVKDKTSVEGLDEAPIELDPEDPMNPMIVGTGSNPAKLKYRMMRAARQLAELAKRSENASPKEWQNITRNFKELSMNIDEIEHGLGELAKTRRKGGLKSRGIDPEIESVVESDVVLDKTDLRKYIVNLIVRAINQETDIDKLSKLLMFMVGKKIKTRGKRYSITAEDVIEACKSNMRASRG